jgi:hypothetical protein
MKKKSASRSAFFNLRVLIGLGVVLAGVFLALAGLGTFSAIAANSAQAQPKQQKPKIVDIKGLPPGFDCSKIHELGIDKMENLRAGRIMIACGAAQGGSSSPRSAFARLTQDLLPAPLAYGAADVDLVTHPETPPNITQSETYSIANPDNPNMVLVAYNDSRGRQITPINISAVSVSTDGGLTFDRLTCSTVAGSCTQVGQGPFAGTEGDPVILYNRPTGKFFTIWIDTGCGGGGMGGYYSSTPTDPTSWTHYCVHSGGSDDRESGWADNTPSSPFYGNMYMSENDFAVGGGALFVSRSTDNGVTWSRVQLTNTFIRDVQITGDVTTGYLYVAGMDEGGGGFPHNDVNYIFKSTDGGATFTNTYVGPSFPGPGVTAVGYFACMFPDLGGYWRHEGWGEPAAYNNVVHLVYDQHGTGSDPADVYYIRSTDGGVTFGAPFKLNTDSTARPNWQPNISVSPAGTLLATWYDARETTTCAVGNTADPCYRMWSRKSNDNGVTWLPDDTLSDVISPLPAQPDMGIVSIYVGDYDYGSAILTKHVTSWVDGRVAIGGQSQQDAFTDRELVGFAVTTTTPTCNSVINTQPTDFVINLSDPVDTSSVQASDFTVNGTPSNLTPTFSNGNATITFHFSSTPVTLGTNTMHIPAGAILRASDEMPNFEFLCSFCYAVTPLMVTTTNPPVGGTFTGPGMQDLAVTWNQAVDPGSVSASDLSISGIPATVTGVDVSGAVTTFHINFTGIFSGQVTATIGAGSITANGCNPNVAFSGNYNYVGSVCDTGLIQNEGFETGDFTHWTIDGNNNTPVVTNTQHHSGTFSAYAGGAPPGFFCGLQPPEALGDSSFYQQFGPVPASATLSFWHMDCTTDSITFDWQDAYITDSSGNILQTIYHLCDSTTDFVNVTVDMSTYAGQTVRIKFLTHDDGFSTGDITGQFIDDVVLFAPCGSPTPTSTPTATATATATSTPIATPTATFTPTPTPTPTPRATPTPRPVPTPRARPTPPPRP